MKDSTLSDQNSAKPKTKLVTADFIVSTKQISLDQKMIAFDLWGTTVHVLMLYKQAIIKKNQLLPILKALTEIQNEVNEKKFLIDPKQGAQLTLEAKIIEKAGDIGKAVHTGRSRNDQIMVTEMLYLRESIIKFIDSLSKLFQILLALAKKHQETVMPGYTHMQPAKVTTFGQWTLAYLNGLLRAGKTIRFYYETYNLNPLGACESYGTSWPIDRQYTSMLLGFGSVWEIPQDAVSSRGLVQLGYLTGLRDISLVAGKLASDLLLFTTFEYNLVKLGDNVAQRMHPITGSSIMAQKKNPDVLELTRSTFPQISGITQIVENILSNLPMGYNRDSREVKEYIDLGLSKTTAVVNSLINVLSTIKINTKQMEESVKKNYSLTTDLADYISQQSGTGYRLIYQIVGQLVDKAITDGRLLEEISAAEIKQKALTFGIVLQLTDKELKIVLNPSIAINKRTHIGGSGQESMAQSLKKAQALISDYKIWVSKENTLIKEAKDKTQKVVLAFAGGVEKMIKG